ncbi:methyltransferase type 11 [Microcoleus sp. EPA2]|uniref:O-linked N-acetylglucosamine transferase family protein n=1 Tax=Microcoleus sp. EPA2 TaxID=2841654 RepID=UPI00312B4706
MTNWQLKTPVCLIIFKRPDTTAKVFEAIRQVKPSQLLVIADGPRPDKLGESEKCEATRQIIEGVDWDCEVLKNYSDVNLGLKHRVATGLDWVFKTVEEAIILEDDCLPDATFFRFCEELLEYYRHNPQIMVIAGTNFLFGWKPNNDSYYFTRYIDCWGWATWRRAWQHFDFEMKQWPERRDRNWLAEFLQDSQVAERWTKTFQATYDGYINSWAFRWKFACWLQNGFTIIPEINLVSNIGFDNPDSTNTINVDSLLANTLVQPLEFPLRHPLSISRDPQVDEFIQKIVFSGDSSYLRSKMANVWLNLTREELEDIPQQDIIIRILSSCTIDQAITKTEKNLVQELMVNMSTELNETKAIQNLLVAMLYIYPHQLPLQYDLSRIPQWLLNNYIKFILEAPISFKEMGESEEYSHHLRKVINTLHTYIFSNPTATNSQELALLFTLNVKFFMDFSPENLKEIYKKRADIMEFSLRSQGYQLEYDFPARIPARSKIRLGIIVNKFEPNPETFATLSVYKHLNRDLFEIILYSTQASGHRIERYCSGHADAAVQLPEDLYNQVKTIRDDDLDLIFIASDITSQTNLITLLSLHRLARVQVVGRNSTGTTGMSNVDYFISGKLTELENGAQEHYTETLVMVEGPSLCFDFATEEQLLVTTSISRESLGIAQNSVVYISGVDFDKILPEVQAAWAQILARVPNSILVLYLLNDNITLNSSGKAFKDRFLQVLENHGLNENQLRFLEPLPNRADIKECLKNADIYLDSYPSSGMASLIDPLEAGLATVVKEGESARYRLGSSLLRELEVTNLIANSEEAYIQLAVALALNSQLREKTSEQIKQKMQRKPRFLDSRSYSAQMQALFQQFFSNYQANALTENLRLREVNLIVFPDWSQSEESLYEELGAVLIAIATHPDKSNITLLIDNSNISEEDAHLLLSSVAMNLLMEEDLDVSEGPEISLIGQLSEIQWEVLIPRLHGKIGLEHENKEAIAHAKAEKIALFELDSLKI